MPFGSLFSFFAGGLTVCKSLSSSKFAFRFLDNDEEVDMLEVDVEVVDDKGMDIDVSVLADVFPYDTEGFADTDNDGVTDVMVISYPHLNQHSVND